MEKRSHESHMDWEYQNAAPMDPSSPFARSTKKAQQNNIFGGSPSKLVSFGQTGGLTRSQSTPSKTIPSTSMQRQQNELSAPSIFHNARLARTITAPSFRNPAFTTPRRPFDVDTMSEFSPAESSPAATIGSDYPETPDHDYSFDMTHTTSTPSTVGRHSLLSPKKASGKGEIAKPVFSARDKVRKRKRYNADKDISGYRLPYIQLGEGDESDYESDESTFQPNKPPSQQKRKRDREGWFGGFLATIQRHPYAPSILGYWLNFCFSVVCMAGTLWIGWAIIAGLREDFAAARTSVRDEIIDEMAKCRSDYIDNKCAPVEQRLPAMYQLCEQWHACMNKNPDQLKKIQLGAKNIIEIVNEIVDTMSYKTIALLVLLFAIVLFSGRSLYKTAHEYPDFSRHAPPAYMQQHASEQVAPQQVYWQAIQPQTPRHNLRHLPSIEDTPDTDASPPRYKALLPPRTPSGRLSPTKTDRGRSPTKSRSPTKHY